MGSRRFGRIQALWLLAGLLLGFIFLGAYIGITRWVRPAPIVISPVAPTTEPTSTGTPASLTIFISGEVTNPGVYKFPAGSIVQAAIEAAGGYSLNADQDLVNLAQRVSDGLHIHVPSIDENKDVPIFSNESSEVTAESKKVNINTAGLEELDTLPGIGPVTARKIMEYRSANGPFTNIEAIMDVDGIGSGKFGDIRDLITTE